MLRVTVDAALSSASSSLVDDDGGAAVQALLLAQPDEALDDGPQLDVAPVVPEDAGRAGVRHDVRVPRFHTLTGEPPVPLRRALRRVHKHRMLALPIVYDSRRSRHSTCYHTSALVRLWTAIWRHGTLGLPQHCLCRRSPAGRTVSWFSRKVVACEGHQPIRPGGLPSLSRSRLRSPRCSKNMVV